MMLAIINLQSSTAGHDKKSKYTRRVGKEVPGAVFRPRQHGGSRRREIYETGVA